MSADAIAKARKLWEKLTFARVGRTVAREPEDVLWVKVHRPSDHREDGWPIYHSSPERLELRRPSTIPAKDAPHARIAWRHFYGFADDIYFRMDDYCELDFTTDCTGDFSRWGNHTSGFTKRPKNGDWIAGTVMKTSRGKRFDKWFILTPELRFLIELVRAGSTNLKEEELARYLMVSDFPDALWAFARLVLFDNVQAFVDDCKDSDEQPPHPCFGQKYGDRAYNGAQLSVEWHGMYLPKSAAYMVHVLSHHFEPKWWQEFKAAFSGNPPPCVGRGGLCPVCEAELRAGERHFFLTDGD